MKAKTSLALLLLCSNFMYGQANFADANRAMVLCNNEPVVIQELGSAGLNAAANTNPSCYKQAYSETKVASDGDLGFTLLPLDRSGMA